MLLSFISGGKIQPWSAVQLLESTLRYFMYPEASNNHLQQKSFADFHLLTEDFNFYLSRLDVKINKYLYEEKSPKFPLFATIALDYLSYDVASGSEITPCNKICKPLVVYRFTGNVMTSITTLRT